MGELMYKSSKDEPDVFVGALLAAPWAGQALPYDSAKIDCVIHQVG
jgi:hypothetical protein